MFKITPVGMVDLHDMKQIYVAMMNLYMRLIEELETMLALLSDDNHLIATTFQEHIARTTAWLVDLLSSITHHRKVTTVHTPIQ